MQTPSLTLDADSRSVTTRLRLERVSHQDWVALAPTMSGYSYRQSWGFSAAAAKRVGGSSEHVGIFRGRDCVSLAEVRVRKLPLLGGGIAYISGGPLVQPGPWITIEEFLDNALESLVGEYVTRRGMVLRVAPPIEWAAEGWDVNPLFERLRCGSAASPRPYRTIMINLAPGEEELRKNLNQKWRNQLNRCEKNGLTVRAGGSVELLDRFCGLHRELMDRKGFDVDLSAEFYRNLQSSMDAGEKFHIQLVEVDGNPVAGHVGSLLGQTSVYLLGAANQVGNDLKASYLLQWTALTHARQRGCAWYDLGGIDPVGNPGVYMFKERMGGIDITAHGPFEFRPSGMRARVAQWAEQAYRTLRRRTRA